MQAGRQGLVIHGWLRIIYIKEIRMKKLLIALMLGMLLFSGCSSKTEADEPKIQIVDPSFEVVVTKFNNVTEETYRNGKVKPSKCIYVDVDLEALTNGQIRSVKARPFVSTSLTGLRNHFEAQGVNAIYWLSNYKFRIYLNWRDGVTAEQAQEWNWNLVCRIHPEIGG